MNYTPEQKKAIQCVDKDLVVTAGAGTGKTRVLVDRIIYIIKKGYAKIDEIVAITYTNKAALEIKERLRQEMKKQTNVNLTRSIEKLQVAYIGTVHSFCLRLLQENPVQADLDSEVSVIEEYRAKALLKESVQKVIIDHLDDDIVYRITEELGYENLSLELFSVLIKILNQGFPIEKLAQRTESVEEKVVIDLLKQSLTLYSNKKKSLGIIDFEDILQKSLKLLKDNPDILRYYYNKLKYIMVDEYQDLNFTQDKILRLLGSESNLFVVGDKKQSIYGFRGAQVKLFERLLFDLKQRGQNIILKDNFRSSGNIIDFVNTKFKNIITDYDKIKPFNSRKTLPNIEILFPDGKGLMGERRQREATMIANKINLMMNNQKIRIYDKNIENYRRPMFKDFCVLLRKRTHLAYYLNAFEKAGIPFHVANTGSLINSKVVKQILNALKTVEFQDEISLYGTLIDLLNVDSLDLLDFDYEKFFSKTDDFFENIPSKLESAFQKLFHWIEKKHKNSIYELIEKIIDDTNLKLKAAKSGIQELENLYRLKYIAEQYDKQGCTLKRFLDEIENFGEDQEEVPIVNEEDDVVKFITIHSSKGLEFPIVILADAANTISFRTSSILFEPEAGISLKKDKEKWNKIKQIAEEKEVEEAKRLLYVAITRARDYVIISGEDKLGKRPSFLKWILKQGEDFEDLIITRDLRSSASTVDLEDESRETIKAPTNIKKSAINCRQIFSPTSISSFFQCPQKYYLSRVAKIPENIFYEKEESKKQQGLTPIVRGNIVHELIEKSHFYNIKPDELLDEFISNTKLKMEIEDINFIKKCLENYNKSNINKIEGTYYSEIPFFWDTGLNCFMTGKIDRLIVNKDNAAIIDFKTNTKIFDDAYNMYEIQLMIYLLAIEEILNIKVSKAIMASLYEGRDYEIDISQHNKKEFKQYLFKAIDKIIKNDTKQVRESKSCNYCGYKGKICKQ